MKEIICLGDTMHEVRLALERAEWILKPTQIPFKYVKYKNELTIFNTIKIIGISSYDISNLKYYTNRKAEAFNAEAFLMMQDPEDQLKVILGR